MLQIILIGSLFIVWCLIAAALALSAAIVEARPD